MRNLATDPDQHFCRCGALCERTSTRCRKCRARRRLVPAQGMAS
jgi:hypothetical protein